jgi:DNA recombination protein RmuC
MTSSAILALGLLLGFAIAALWRRQAAPRMDFVEAGIERLRASQEQLRQEVQQGRETSLLRLGEVTQGIRLQLGQAQRALAEVHALEQGRGTLLRQSSESLRRLEAILGDSSARGAAGENVLARALGQLPPDMLELNAPFGSRVVEYALRLPGGRLLPIDSKWPSVAALARLALTDDEAERRKLCEQIRTELRSRAREMARYLDGERTLSLAVLAVPDAVYAAAPEARAEGWRDGVLIAPYSQTLPLVLTVYRLALRFGASLDTERVGERLQRLTRALEQLDDEVEGRLSRALVQTENSRQALRQQLAEARSVAEALKRSVEVEEPAATGSFVE